MKWKRVKRVWPVEEKSHRVFYPGELSREMFSHADSRGDGVTTASTRDVPTTWLRVPESTGPVVISSQWAVEETRVGNDKNEL
jgi:hypothetical protein